MKLIKVKIDTGERPNGICGEGEESIKNLLSERQHRKNYKGRYTCVDKKVHWNDC